MLGLDRAIITTQILEFDADQLKLNILKKFGIKDNFHSNNIEKIYINKNINISTKFKYINWIKIIKKPGTLKNDRCKLMIEINYPKFFNSTNFMLVTNQLDKEKVDFAIRLILSELFEVSPELLQLDYNELEIGDQMNVKKFSDYTNVLFLIYKAFCNSFETDSKCMFGDYSSLLDRFYTTGFSFKITKGLTLKVYNKTLENNKKNKLDKITDGVLRSELNITSSIIKTLLSTTNVDSITIDKTKYSIKNCFEQSIKESIRAQILKNQDEIIKRLNKIKITPRSIEVFVTENNEWIIDDDTFNCILHKEVIKTRTEITSKRCQAMAKQKLIDLATSNSPRRNNSKNMKRLEIFLKNLFDIDIKIRQRRKEEIQIF